MERSYDGDEVREVLRHRYSICEQPARAPCTFEDGRRTDESGAGGKREGDILSFCQ